MRPVSIFALTALLACSCRGRSADLPDASPLTPTANATKDRERICVTTHPRGSVTTKCVPPSVEEVTPTVPP